MAEQTFAARCVANNALYADAYHHTGAKAAPRQRAAVVTCMDARIDPAQLLGLEDGDAHVIRNAGGVVTEDVIRSLVISQRLLGTREIVLIQHTDCGMTTFQDDDLKASILADTGLRPAFAFEAFRDPYLDVRQSMRRILACPFLPAGDQVRGFVCDVQTGRLREVESEESRA